MLTHRFGNRAVMIVGLLMITLGCLFLATMTTRAGIPGFIERLPVIFTGQALFQTANNSAIMESAPHPLVGLITIMLAGRWSG
ncbi:MAG: hypothetical protein M3Z08_16270 [Chloroflexota bacterium]|nr:hypothetical protein [Chloroflexota bacterium]